MKTPIVRKVHNPHWNLSFVMPKLVQDTTLVVTVFESQRKGDQIVVSAT